MTREHPTPPMTLTLTCTPAMHCFHVVGDVSFARRREDLRAIAMFAVERGGALTAEELHAALLPRLPVAASRRMLSLCQSLGLCKWEPEGRWRLTDEGRRTAAEGTVFVPERGTWTVWFTNDPLVPVTERLLRIDRFKEPDAHAESKQRKEEAKAREFVELPPWVEEAAAAFEGTPAWSEDTGKAVRVVRLEAEAEPTGHLSALHLIVSLAPDRAGTIALRGTIDGVDRAHEFAPPTDMTFTAAWPLALGPRAHDWDGRTLAVSFDELTDTGRERALHTLEVTMPAHRGWGALTAAPVRDVPVRARAASDAQRWAEWVVTNAVTSYVPASRYRELWAAARARFPEHAVAELAQRDLAARFRAQGGAAPPRYWHLQAPTDWNL